MLLDTIKQELSKHDRPENKIDAQRFHKEKLTERFVFKAPVLRKISNEIYQRKKMAPETTLHDLFLPVRRR